MYHVTRPRADRRRKVPARGRRETAPADSCSSRATCRCENALLCGVVAMLKSAPFHHPGTQHTLFGPAAPFYASPIRSTQGALTVLASTPRRFSIPGFTTLYSNPPPCVICDAPIPSLQRSDHVFQEFNASGFRPHCPRFCINVMQFRVYSLFVGLIELPVFIV